MLHDIEDDESKEVQTSQEPETSVLTNIQVEQGISKSIYYLVLWNMGFLLIATKESHSKSTIPEQVSKNKELDIKLFSTSNTINNTIKYVLIGSLFIKNLFEWFYQYISF